MYVQFRTLVAHTSTRLTQDPPTESPEQRPCHIEG